MKGFGRDVTNDSERSNQFPLFLCILGLDGEEAFSIGRTDDRWSLKALEALPLYQIIPKISNTWPVDCRRETEALMLMILIEL